MKMAKASEKDKDAAGDLMALLGAIDRGHYPFEVLDGEDTPDFFDEDDREHLRAFYDAVMETMNRAPGWPGRVIGGMCYVILFDKNEIVDPDLDHIELHPRLVRALKVEAEVEAAKEAAK